MVSTDRGDLLTQQVHLRTLDVGDLFVKAYVVYRVEQHGHAETEDGTLVAVLGRDNKGRSRFVAGRINDLIQRVTGGRK
jgi:hypothetical protein